MIGHEVPPAETPETIFQVEFPKGEHINVRLRARALHIRRRWRVVWTMVIGGSTCPWYVRWPLNFVEELGGCFSERRMRRSPCRIVTDRPVMMMSL